jgi:hypothetical protein
MAWRQHADAVQEATLQVGSTVRADASPRVSRQPYRGVVVDGDLLAVVNVHERLGKLTDTCHKRLFANKAQS